MILKHKAIGLIIGGGIAAYKSLDLIRRLQDCGAAVHVILTPAAQQFVTKLSAAALSHLPVQSSLFEGEHSEDINHIALVNKLDLIIVAPATANRLASTAAGLAQDFAGALLLAATCPVLFAPAMNPNMWAKPQIQRAIHRLQQDGYAFIGPNSGAMAEKHCEGMGRMSEVPEIVSKTKQLLLPKATPITNQELTSQELKGKKFIVTTGATLEPIDPVRYISNYSSGKQGFAIAEALQKRGASVVVVCGIVSAAAPKHIELVHVTTAAEMLDAVTEQLPADGAIFAAAVCDWRVATAADQKLKKQGETMQLHMVKNPDILQIIATSPGRPKLVVGFAAETENHLVNARAKLHAKQADIIIVNNVAGADSAFNSDYNQISIVEATGEQHLPKLSKQELGQKLTDFIITAYNNL